MFKYDSIISFIKNPNGIEFYISIWQYLIVEFIKTFYTSMPTFTVMEEFTVYQQVIKIIHNALKMITYSTHKGGLIELNKNPYFEILLTSLNLIDFNEVLIKLLKIQIDRSYQGDKEIYTMSNFLWENCNIQS